MNFTRTGLFFLVFTLSFPSYAVDTVTKAGTYGNFSFYPYIDPINDNIKDFIRTFAKQDNSAQFTISCESDGLNVVINTGQTFDKSENAEVVYRLDKEEAVTLKGWIVSTDSEYLFMPMDNISKFLEQALDRQQIVTRTYDTFGDFKTYTFAFNGFRDALPHLGCFDDEDFNLFGTK